MLQSSNSLLQLYASPTGRFFFPELDYSNIFQRKHPKSIPDIKLLPISPKGWRSDMYAGTFQGLPKTSSDKRDEYFGSLYTDIIHLQQALLELLRVCQSCSVAVGTCSPIRDSDISWACCCVFCCSLSSSLCTTHALIPQSIPSLQFFSRLSLFQTHRLTYVLRMFLATGNAEILQLCASPFFYS